MVWLRRSLCLTALTGVLSAPGVFTAPTVSISNGTIIGSSAAGVDSFKGIPFAVPPVGDLRLKPPQTITQTYGTLYATEYAKSCIQQFIQYNTSTLPGDVIGTLANDILLQTVLDTDEDCLYLNVQRPAGTNSSSNLPVAVWIYGGAFELGSASMYDATQIVSRSVALGAPIVYASMNYRLNGYGFLAGKELQQEGSTNIGMRDQRKALEWVSENIAAFGGDPNKVTIFGESAGAISAFNHILAYGGDNTYQGRQLFRGAIMDSGSTILANPVSDGKPQAVYDAVVEAAGCSSTADTLSCLRSRPAKNFTDSVNRQPAFLGYRSADVVYQPRPDPADDFYPQSPEIAMAQGAYARVPVIIGDQEDEGTLFALFQENITTTEELVDYMASCYPHAPRSAVEDFVESYPDDPAAGSPFRTGDLNQLYPQFKRLAAILGDITFNLLRRYTLSQISSSVPTWSFLNTYLHGTPILGTFHASDLAVLYTTAPTSTIPLVTPIDYYISFFNYLDPNALGATSQSATFATNWPTWQNSTRQLLDFSVTGASPMTDDYRTPQYDAIVRNLEYLKV